MGTIRFTKMHGLGNDYVYINCLDEEIEDFNHLALKISDRHTGVGSDGLIAICKSDVADFRMRMFNADGSEGRMCGNGARCVGKYVADKGLTNKSVITLETLAGIKTLKLYRGEDDKVNLVTVDMGEPITDVDKIPVVSAVNPMIEQPVQTPFGEIKLTAISMGNPHGVVFVSDLSTVDVHSLGRSLECNPIWPDRANIEFVQQVSPNEVRMRVWERGSGETMACGTGACATVVAGILTNRLERDASVHLLGGDLQITWDSTDNHVYMTGPAVTVFDGEYIYE